MTTTVLQGETKFPGFRTNYDNSYILELAISNFTLQS